MKQKLVALFLIIVMATSALTAVGLATTTTVAATTATRTTLNATAPATALTSKDFTIKGRLTSDGAGIRSQNVSLDRWNGTAWAHTGYGAATNGTGWYSVKLHETAAGTYDYRTAYAGNSVYTKATSNVVKVTVRIPTSVDFLAVPLEIVKGAPTGITFALFAQGGKSISGGTVSFFVDGKYAGQATSSKSGDGHFIIPGPSTRGLTLGQHTLTASFPGNAQYAPGTDKTRIDIVNKFVPTLTITYMQIQGVSTFDGKLSYSGNGVVGAPVTLWRLDSANSLVKVGTRNTDSKGYYCIDDITHNYTGTYRYYATYPGSSMYTSAQTHSITVTY